MTLNQKEKKTMRKSHLIVLSVILIATISSAAMAADSQPVAAPATTNSGIVNNAFYLLVHGGTNNTSKIAVAGLGMEQGGMEKGLKIYGRALIYYMTPSTNFAQARAATIQAATDLYGADSVEVRMVKESWTAVGVN